MIMKKSSGFTIVELLIVIVVIAILATITIVVYGSVQNRARSSAGQSQVNHLAKKVESFNTVNNTYPTYCQLITNSLSPTGAGSGVGVGTCAAGGSSAGLESKIDTPNSMSSTDVTSTTAANGSVVTYKRCTTNGAKVRYWDYAATTPALVDKNLGNVTTCP
ncbi:exported protein of unknown function [Candidatus Saccharimonas aalborgensis]|jgi:prepilin-type N-terminal cleavage/methylation domain-containing protein|uniref:Prepilin-type N-terminal cleavage/methylation domain-containing protein n=1 Tax=Candidatus Saccharimonas aalborgensis TaxID=1332188 RepID=R4PKD6_9BACT|nr:prepilin-type N-terminal cleavage/methylation domain-containing protein [Candidatus Saccharimonas aalborgensis]AGL62008.1 exported protein of unknown function [Candidatus Saccharimonas aalborgensis]QQS68534.1 MAG: prepilin-type N-terminal cleavage/methylation domain-containing protein [Candidatus Saccharibacteria bacterium]